MSHFKNLTILICSLFILISCKENKTETTTKAKEEKKEPFKGFNVPSQNATAQNAQGVYHYTCSNGCAGGAAAAGNCASCGNALAHNQAYHTNTNNTSLSTPTNTISNPTTTGSGQNAAGVWHYTCSNGCAGGAGSAGNCSTCGNALAHNSAYH